VWIRSSARRSPATREIPLLEQRIERLIKFEKWRKPTRIDFEAVVGPDFWQAHWNNLTRFFELMKEAELHARMLRLKIEDSLQLAHSQMEDPLSLYQTGKL
jgi:hypothetical protein